ncbi:MAG: hypothetical protein AB1599_08740, partial [Planctomycetota bacterium]
TTLSIILKHINEKPPVIRKENPDVPECVSNVINRMLEKDPAKRYQTSDELVDAINLCENKIVSTDSNAKTITAQAAPVKTKQRNIASWKMIGLAAAAAFVIVVLLSALSKGKQPAPRKEPLPAKVPNATEQVTQFLKDALTQRCNEFYKYLVDKDYNKAKPYLYIPRLTRMSENDARQAAIRILKRKYDLHEKRGNKPVEFRIKNIKSHEPNKDMPLVNATVELDLLLYNTKQPPKHKDDYISIPQSHIWVLDKGVWHISLLHKGQEDRDDADEADEVDFKKEGPFVDFARFLSLTNEQTSQVRQIIAASQEEAWKVLSTPRADGIDVVDELSKLQTRSLSGDEKEKKLIQIFSMEIPGSNETYFGRLATIRFKRDVKLKGALSDEQFQKYREKNLDIFDVKIK